MPALGKVAMLRAGLVLWSLLAGVVWGPIASVADEISIGVISPLTGVRADAGAYSVNGLKIALDELNDTPGLKHSIRLIAEDSRYDPKTAVSAFMKLTEMDKVRVIFGPYGSGEVAAVAPLSEKAGVILILPGAQSPEISGAGKLIFRLIHNAAQEAPFFADFTAGHMQGDTLQVIAAQLPVTGAYFAVFRPRLEKLGRKFGEIEEFEVQNTDFRPQLLKIKQRRPTDIYAFGAPVNVGQILSQARQLGIRARWFGLGVEGPEIVRQAGPAAEGLLYPYSYDSADESAAIREFLLKYRSRFGEDPDAIAANSYDGLKLLSGCFEAAGTEVAAVAACLYRTRDYPGAGGVFSINSEGDAERRLIVKTVRHGRFVRYQGEDAGL